jgi:hypothetical protein
MPDPSTPCGRATPETAEQFVKKEIEAKITQIPALSTKKTYDHGEQSY